MSSRRDSPGGRRKALGRGLDALLSSKPGGQAAPNAPGAGQDVRKVSVDRIDPNPHQPRTVFRPEAIEELAQSIRNDGVLQPILLRPSGGGRYHVVAGERRLRASKHAGLTEIPAIVRHFDDDQMLEIALVENIQREDLNPIEVALGLQTMAQTLQLSHEELAQRTGKDRTTVTNLLRLLRLPVEIQQLVGEKKLTMGHARALLSLENEDQQREIALRAVDGGWSVRQVEQTVRNLLNPPEPKEAEPVDPNVAAAVESLEASLGTRVRLVQRSPNKGRIEIEYASSEELDRLYGLLTGDA